MMTTKVDSSNTAKGHLNKHYANRGGTYKTSGSEDRGEKYHSKKNSPRMHSTRKKPLEPMHKIEWPEHLCEKCGKPITDLTQALSDKSTGEPVHFECILDFLKNSEELKEKEEVVYIGNGNFAIVYFENPRIRKKFKIVKLIEWEDRNKTCEWRDEVARLGSST